MLTQEENETLTRVGPDTPMGRLLREYWHPACRSEALEAGGAPLRIELLCEKLVAFRSPDGSVGVLDEFCPHRRVSLAIGRNEPGGLRCIYHGWKFDHQGTVIEVPSEPPESAEAFRAKVRMKGYPHIESGGVIWVYLGKEQTPPAFPYFEFTVLPPEHVDVRIGVVNCNWVQGVEGTLDSAHLPYLHRSQDNGQIANDKLLADTPAPVFEIADTPYGFREGAVRRMKDGRRYVKIREIVAPYYSYVPGFPENLANRMVVASVPFNDTCHAQWHFYYNVQEPLEPQALQRRWLHSGPDKNDFYADHGGFHDLWKQDRRAMSEGHFSGLVGRYISVEDFIVQEAMGPILDRTKEYLGRSDTIIIYMRRKLLNAAKAHARDGSVWGRSEAEGFDFSSIRSCAVVLPGEARWQDVDARELLPAA